MHRPNSSLPIDCSSAPVWNALIASPHSSAAMCAGSVRPPLTPLSGPCSRRHPRGSSIRTYRDTRFRKAPSAAAVDRVELMDWEPETGRDVPSQHRRFHLARSAAADRAWSSARAHAGRTEAERARAQPARGARQDVGRLHPRDPEPYSVALGHANEFRSASATARARTSSRPTSPFFSK